MAARRLTPTVSAGQVPHRRLRARRSRAPPAGRGPPAATAGSRPRRRRRPRAAAAGRTASRAAGGRCRRAGSARRRRPRPALDDPDAVYPSDRASHSRSAAVLGQQVGAAQPLQLQPVLGPAQERVGGGHLGAVGAPDVAAPDQRPQAHQGARQPQVRVGPAVHQLQQLDGELDVPQAAGAELEFAVALPFGDVLLDPAAHRLHVVDEGLPPGGRPDAGRGDVQELLAQVGVAGGRPGLEQRLELPGVRPPLVVAGQRGRGADQRAGLALRSQRGVDLPGRGRRRSASARRPAALAVASIAVSSAGVLGSGVVGGEDDVDVGEVVQLLGAALAHRDDGEPGGRRAGRQLGRGDRQPGLQGGVGQVGQRLADGGQRGRRQRRSRRPAPGRARR